MITTSIDSTNEQSPLKMSSTLVSRPAKNDLSWSTKSFSPVCSSNKRLIRKFDQVNYQQLWQNEVMIKLDWTPLTIGEIEKLLNDTESVNWMQTWPYAFACHQRDQKNCQIVRIIENNETIGLVAIEQIQLGFIHLININRGPLWLRGQKMNQRVLEFANLMNSEFPARWFRRRRWLPEIESNEKLIAELKNVGFQLTQHSFDTIWLDLTQAESDLRKQLHAKWRNGLVKAEKSNLKVDIQTSIQNFSEFIVKYSNYKKIKKFIGPTAEFLSVEVKTGMRLNSHLLVWGKKEEQNVAGMLIALHGKTASYRVGWNSEAGRENNAHYLMLWQLMLYLKSKGFEKFDLGGILPNEEPELTHFKRGLGGKEVHYLGYLK